MAIYSKNLLKIDLKIRIYSIVAVQQHNNSEPLNL